MDCERRLAGRHRVVFDVVCDGDTSYSKGKVTDLSESGAFLEAPRMYPEGTRVSLTPIGKAADHLFELEATVIRIHPTGMALRFGAVHEEDEDGLRRLMREMPETLADPSRRAPLNVGEPSETTDQTYARVHGGTRTPRTWARLRAWRRAIQFAA